MRFHFFGASTSFVCVADLRASAIGVFAAARPSLPKWLDEDYYREKVLPHLSKHTITKIQVAMDVSHPYAAMVRKGIKIPQPRDWVTLAQLVGIDAASCRVSRLQ